MENKINKYTITDVVYKSDTIYMNNNEGNLIMCINISTIKYFCIKKNSFDILIDGNIITILKCDITMYAFEELISKLKIL